MKILRMLAGIVLLFGGLFVIIGEHFAGTSGDATINARVNVVRTPIDGIVTLAIRRVGARINEGELVADIADDRFDTARLLDLERNVETQKIELARIDAQKRVLSETRAQFQAQLEAYKKGRENQISARIAEAKAAEDASVARLQEAENALKRANDLNDRGVQTAAALDKARASNDVAKQELESARQRTKYLETELKSAESGVFIGDSYNDAPFSSQRVRDLDLRLAELVAEREAGEARLAQYQKQVAAERVRVNKLTSATLNAQVTGMAWDFLVDNGEYARRGQDLVKLVDCKNLIVTASVRESLYDTLQVGAPVQFRLFGDSRVFNGTITRLGGSGALNLYTNLAVGPSGEHLQRYDVTITVPDLAFESDLSCPIGRTGRVIFTNGPISTLRRFLARFGF